MQTYTYHDRSKWKHAYLIEDEPYDKAVWTDEETGLLCSIVRNYSGAWCGYVALPEGHSQYGVGYASVPVECHGGLTYDGGSPGGECGPIETHVDDKTLWWLGFDCHHSGDGSPSHLHSHDIYKTQQYVMSEVKQLARQLAAL